MQILRRESSLKKLFYSRFIISILALSSIKSITKAEIVVLNLSQLGNEANNITGINAGLTGASGSKLLQTTGVAYVGSGGWDITYNYPLTLSNTLWGISGSNGMQFAITTDSRASPKNFSANSLIDASATWTTAIGRSVFKNDSDVSPDFSSSPKSYLGFQTNDGNFGWIEATWNSSLVQFQFTAAAYETTVGVGIRAGATSVPEPGTLLLGSLTLLAGASGSLARNRWKTSRNKRKH